MKRRSTHWIAPVMYRYDFLWPKRGHSTVSTGMCDISAHYYVALDAGDDGRTLAETSYKFAPTTAAQKNGCGRCRTGARSILRTDQGATFAPLAAMTRRLAICANTAIRPRSHNSTQFCAGQSAPTVAAGNSVTVLDQAGRRFTAIRRHNRPTQTAHPVC